MKHWRLLCGSWAFSVIFIPIFSIFLIVFMSSSMYFGMAHLPFPMDGAL